MNTWVDAATTFIAAHSHWVGVLVFLISAGEAIVLIGYVLPGTAILLAVGGLIGLGHLPLLPVLLWGVRLAVTRLAPLADRIHRCAFAWAMARPEALTRRLAAPFDPDHPATPALIATLALLVGASLAFAKVVEDVVTGDPLVVADQAISNFVTGLRNPWTDPLMVSVTALGDAAVTVALVVTVLVWLLAVGSRRLAGAFAMALVASEAAVLGIKGIARVPRPEALYSGIDAFAFPSAHTTFAAVLFGLVAWLVGGAAHPLARALAYAAAFGWALAIAVSRIYLGTHWPSDVLGGLLLGVAVCASVAILYAHVPRERPHPGGLALDARIDERPEVTHAARCAGRATDQPRIGVGTLRHERATDSKLTWPPDSRGGSVMNIALQRVPGA